MESYSRLLFYSMGILIISHPLTEKGDGLRLVRAGLLLPGPDREGLLWAAVHGRQQRAALAGRDEGREETSQK